MLSTMWNVLCSWFAPKPPFVRVNIDQILIFGGSIYKITKLNKLGNILTIEAIGGNVNESSSDRIERYAKRKGSDRRLYKTRD